MLTSAIITQFERQVDDITELSSAEELTLANRVYLRICRDRGWEWLKKPAAGSIVLDGTTGLYYIAIPSDFAMFAPNADETENFTENQSGKAPMVIFVGSKFTKYQIVNFSERRQYRNRPGFAYLDFANSKIWLTDPTAPYELTYEFDYIKVPVDLTLSTAPAVPAQFAQPMADAIMYGMATENDVLQLSDKAKSYLKENNAFYEKTMLDMQYMNANLQLY